MAEGTNIILFNSDEHVLMYLRDDKPEIPYPGMWSLLGGMVEAGETPQECILRELYEEIGLRLDPNRVRHFRTRQLDGELTEHTFVATVDLDLTRVTLTEGQALRWFSADDIQRTTLAYGDNALLDDFFTALRAERQANPSDFSPR
ncbi:NUDIX hydrolase [Longimycelium tulufanense]|uniref:NUDIX hydrolase n=1 Tax=Longimycelium tulufanense TaxID=907463 RepID=UPI001E3F247F|nr:NUDIX hydrolase [Longimycelium tulufanense]